MNHEDQSRVGPLKLSAQQQEQIRKVTGKEADTLELRIEELEERIAPGHRLT